MKITEKQLKEKQVAGKTKDGQSVLYVETHGGLHLFFVKKEKKLLSLSAAPHKAIAQWMAEKQEDIKWNKDFLQKKEVTEDDLRKHEIDLFTKIRELFWCKPQEPLENNRDNFLLYSHTNKTFHVLGKSELEESIKTKQVDKYDVARELSLDKSAGMLFQLRDFEDLF